MGFVLLFCLTCQRPKQYLQGDIRESHPDLVLEFDLKNGHAYLSTATEQISRVGAMYRLCGSQYESMFCLLVLDLRLPNVDLLVVVPYVRSLPP